MFFFFFFKQKTAYEMLRSLVGSEMCIRDRDNKGRGVNVSPVPRKTPEKYGKRRNVEEMENGDTKGGAAKTMKYTLARSNSVCSSDASSQEATYNHKQQRPPFT